MKFHLLTLLFAFSSGTSAFVAPGNVSQKQKQQNQYGLASSRGGDPQGSSYLGSLATSGGGGSSSVNGDAAQQQSGSMASTGGPDHVRKLLAQSKPVKVQGGSLKTWSLKSAAVERVQVIMRTEGRPLDADIDLWHGPDNTPNKMRVYVEDGATRPFSAVIETPRGPNTVAIRNIGQLEFPLDAYVVPNPEDHAKTGASAAETPPPRTIQGGALRTYPFESPVESVQIMLTTDGRPLNARIELLQGPNNIKQVMELYLEDGAERPFFAVIESPGSGNVIRIVNTATVEFPLLASVTPYVIGDGNNDNNSGTIVLGGDGQEFGKRDLQW